MRLPDPRDRALVIFIGALVAGALAYVAATWRGAAIDDECSFSFQCTQYPGFNAPRCSSWGQQSRCTLGCVTLRPACPAGMRCEPADFTVSERGRTTMSVPVAACHR